MTLTDPTPDLAIRLRRAAFNRALAEANLNAISPILSPDVVLITGTDSALLSGRKAQLQAWKQEFAAKDRVVYTRTPKRITVSNVEPIAMEYGEWQGITQQGKLCVAHGDYSAKWRKVGAEWLLIAEIFLTLG